MDNTKHHKNLDNITIAYRLRTLSWSSVSYPRVPNLLTDVKKVCNQMD